SAGRDAVVAATEPWGRGAAVADLDRPFGQLLGRLAVWRCRFGPLGRWSRRLRQREAGHHACASATGSNSQTSHYDENANWSGAVFLERPAPPQPPFSAVLLWCRLVWRQCWS